MGETGSRSHDPVTCTVETFPTEIDAGEEITVTVRTSCPHGCDLSGQRISIRDQRGSEVASVELSESGDAAYATASLALRTPLEIGEHTYRVVFAASRTDGVLHEESSIPFSFVTTAHATSVNVWGIPSAIAAGERFRFKFGIKCSAGCRLGGRPVSISDHEGSKLGAGTLLEDVWPGTSALYFAELEAQAPLTPGDYRWEVETPEWKSSAPHAAGSNSFPVKVVSHPDHLLTIEAFDSETHNPIKGLHVLLHPYRAYTDENGMAKLKVAKGRYKLFVSGFNYVRYEGAVTVAGDLTVRAELAVEPEEQQDYV
jgi:hypothetical protein